MGQATEKEQWKKEQKVKGYRQRDARPCGGRPGRQRSWRSGVGSKEEGEEERQSQ